MQASESNLPRGGIDCEQDVTLFTDYETSIASSQEPDRPLLTLAYKILPSNFPADIVVRKCNHNANLLYLEFHIFYSCPSKVCGHFLSSRKWFLYHCKVCKYASSLLLGTL